MTKALAICPFCDDPRAFTWQGLTMHVKAKHPNKLSELRDNKKMYMSKFACDEAGNPLAESKGGSPSGDSFPEEPEPKEKPTEELDEKTDDVDDEPEPKPEPKRKSKPKPAPEPEPEPEESYFFI